MIEDCPLREVGTLPKDHDVKVLKDHLLGLGMTTRVDDRPEGWAVWVYNEDLAGRPSKNWQRSGTIPTIPATGPRRSRPPGYSATRRRPTSCTGRTSSR